MFRRIYAHPEATSDLFWFCHAGGGSASLFRGARSLSQAVNLYAAVLPGREDRFREGTDVPLESVLEQFTQAILDTLAEAQNDTRRASASEGPTFALIGHSFGSLIGYLIAHRLLACNQLASAMTVMTLASPDRLAQRTPVSHWDDHRLLDYLSDRFNGVPAGLRHDPEAMRLFMPIVRYDLRLMESYQHDNPDPLPIPITAVGGEDDYAVSAADLEGWRSFTRDAFRVQWYPGGHFFPISNVGAIIDVTTAAIRAKETAE